MAASRYARWAEEGEAALVPRNTAERDRDRLLYSTAFRRLGGVTQVAVAGEVALLHNRLTHSLKVAQVARKIGATIRFHCDQHDKVAKACRKFGGASKGDRRREISPVDVWTLEAAGMAHDLGHPPFGHIAEQALQQLLSDDPNALRNKGRDRASLVDPEIPEGYHLPDSFEGNAQSFRVVTRLSFGRYAKELHDEVGLNLSKATLSAMQKYPWLHAQRPPGIDAVKMKWGAYNSERVLLEWAMKGVNPKDGRPRTDGGREYRTVEAQAMDWADDITYAIHDLEIGRAHV